MIRSLGGEGPRFPLLRRPPTPFRPAFPVTPRMRLVLVTLLIALVSAAALLFNPPAVVSYDVGQVADRIVRAPRSVTFVSESLSQEARDRAADSVARVYRRDAAVVTRQVSALTAALGRIAEQRTAALPPEARVVLVEREIGSRELANVALEMPAEEWSTLTRELPDLLRSALAPEIRVEDVEQVRADLARSLPAVWTAAQKRIAGALLPGFVAANTIYDAEATERARQDARASALPVVVQVRAGEVVVRDGSVVTTTDVEKLRALGLSNPGVDWRTASGLALWALLVAAMFTIYLERYQPETWNEQRKLAVAVGGLFILLVASRAVIPGHTLLTYAVPYAAVAMALSVLIAGRTALAVQVAAALHIGVMSGTIEVAAFALLPALLGMSALRRGGTAGEFAVGTAFVAAGNLGLLGSAALLSKSVDPLGTLQLGGAGLANAIASGLFAFAGIVAVGHLTGITTVFELRELGDPNHPLLRQLLLRTPGTYHHSLLVANLAERAAEVIGADALVARVGAYYHDVGKMRNPTAFIENQAGGKNPHEDLDPLVSAQIVAAHVRDGLALAERYRLPEAIREMIPGHHGNGVVKFFYQQAVARGTEPDPEQYRYPGPRPKSREAGIVMLADGVEASVRSLEQKTPDEIRRMVEKIVSERVAENQLDECELTLADIQRIRDAFVELLVGVYHERIPYPEDRIAQLPQRGGVARQS